MFLSTAGRIHQRELAALAKVATTSSTGQVLPNYGDLQRTVGWLEGQDGTSRLRAGTIRRRATGVLPMSVTTVTPIQMKRGLVLFPLIGELSNPRSMRW